MILLDTNVVSEMMKPVPDQAVVRWLDRQREEEVWTSALTVYEVRWGISRLTPGRKRSALAEAFGRLLREVIGGRVAVLDTDAAEAAAALDAQRSQLGELADVLIAGVAISRRMTIATRNVRHFQDLPVPVCNPWTA